MNLQHINTHNDIEDSRGLNPYKYLIERRDEDLVNLNGLYDHLEKLNLQQSVICNVILDKQVLINGKFYDRDDALLNLDCNYWEMLLNDSKIRDLMPYTDYQELVGNFKTRNKEKYIPFNSETVEAFISKLSNSKPLLFANKVNCVLGELDRTFKNNQGSMFPPLIILKAPSFTTYPSWESCEKIDDLRFSIIQIYMLDKKFKKTLDIFHKSPVGEWISLEDDLIRVKRFKNGNVHIAFSDIVYDKLNQVITLVNKNILPEECKKLRKKTYKYEGDING